MTDSRIEALRAAVANGTASGEFVTSLLKQFDQKGYLSDKQWPYVVSYAAPRAPAKRVEVGSFAGVIALFARAREHLKYPKIWLQFADGRPLQLKVCGPNSKPEYQGSVNLTDGGGFENGTWYGRVAANGAVVFARNIDVGKLTEIPELLQRLAAEPEKIASEYGKLTGNCSFCRRPLSDERSTAVGYGKTCADRFGLPWGE